MTQADPIISETIDPPPVACATALLVLGMHRSGTSALARVLNLLGVELGADLLPPAPDNEMGFWEHRQVQFLHDRVYEDMEMDWTNVSPLPPCWWDRPNINQRRDQLKEILQHDFGSFKLWGIKDPRLCAMVPLWRPLLDEMHCQPRCILIFRNPMEVAKSLEKRDNISAARTYLLWLRSVIDSERNSRGLPRTLTTFERLLGDWNSEICRIGKQIRIDWPTPPEQVIEAVTEFIRPDSRHHRVETNNFLSDERVPEQVRRLYSAVLSAAESGQPDELSPVIDLIANELDNGQPLLARFVRDLEHENRLTVIAKNVEAMGFHKEIGRLLQAATEADAANAAAVAAITARDAQLTVAAADRTAMQQQIAGLSTEQARLQQASAELNASLQQTSAELSHRSTQLAATEANLVELVRQIAVQHETIAEQIRLLEQTREEKIATARQLNGVIDQLRDEIGTVYQTRDTLGSLLSTLWRSGLWRWGRPGWWVARAMGKLNRGIDDLIPLTPMMREKSGRWTGFDQPQFLIAIPPLHGRVRLRARIKSSTNSQAGVYCDTGGSFNSTEKIELGPVTGVTEIDRVITLRKTTFMMRFDPVQAAGEFSLESFSLEPISGLWPFGQSK